MYRQTDIEFGERPVDGLLLTQSPRALAAAIPGTDLLLAVQYNDRDTQGAVLVVEEIKAAQSTK